MSELTHTLSLFLVAWLLLLLSCLQDSSLAYMLPCQAWWSWEISQPPFVANLLHRSCKDIISWTCFISSSYSFSAMQGFVGRCAMLTCSFGHVTVSANGEGGTSPVTWRVPTLLPPHGCRIQGSQLLITVKRPGLVKALLLMLIKNQSSGDRPLLVVG